MYRVCDIMPSGEPADPASGGSQVAILFSRNGLDWNRDQTMRTSPAALTARQVEVLLSQLPGVRDGAVADVHDARVATRRLRELLPLAAAETRASTRTACELVRDAGRALGTVRELDTLITLCTDLGNVHPHAAGPLAMTRSRFLLDRDSAARRLVKRLERLDLELLRGEVRSTRAAFLPGAGWRRAFGERLAFRAMKLGSALAHASGVYMPNRLHRVRIHLKKLRYLAEIAVDTGIWRPAHLRRDAARVQDVLGEIHDRQVLLERLAAVDTDPLLMATLRAEIAHRHRSYLAQRERLTAMAEACRRFGEHLRATRGRLLSRTVAALLIPAGVALLAAPSHPEPQEA